MNYMGMPAPERWLRPSLSAPVGNFALDWREPVVSSMTFFPIAVRLAVLECLQP